MDKARRAAASARLLLDAGDIDGACNRAYYAMFDAGRALLIAIGAPSAPETVKTHSGLIAAFSLHAVKSGRVQVELGRSLNKVAEIRLIADYTEDEIGPERGRWAVDQAAIFVEAIEQLLLSK